MFRQIYKSANDDIKADNELLEKILNSNTQQSKKRTFAGYYKYGSLAACALIAIGTLAIYPTISKDASHNADSVGIEYSWTQNSENPEDLEFSNLAPIGGSMKSETDDTSSVADAAVAPKSKNIPDNSNKPTEKTFQENDSEVKNNSDSRKNTNNATPARDSEYVSPSPQSKKAQPTAQAKTPAPRPTQATQESRETVTKEPSSENVPAVAPASEPKATPQPQTQQEDAPQIVNEAPQTATQAPEGRSSADQRQRNLAPEMVSETQAKAIAKEIFSKDLPEDFMKSSTIKLHYDNGYHVTCSNDSESYTIFVSDTGQVTKKY